MKRLTHILILALLAGGGAAARAQDTNSAAGQDFSSFEIIARKNIFDQSRTGVRDFTRARRQPRIERVTLEGIGGDSSDGEAFFGGSGGSDRFLKVGDHIAGFELSRITPDSVRLSNSNSVFVLDMDNRRSLRRVDDGPWEGSSDLSDPVTAATDSTATNGAGETAAAAPGASDAAHPGETAMERKLRLRREQEEK